MSSKICKRILITTTLLLATTLFVGASAQSLSMVTASSSEPQARHLYVDSRLGQLHVWSVAPPKNVRVSQTPLLLIHETSLSSYEFFPYANLMAKDRQVFVLDLPGYGGSAPLKAPLSIEELATAIEDGLPTLLKAANSRQIDILGMHGGSFVAAQIALDVPKNVRRLILAGTVLDIKNEPSLANAHPKTEAFEDLLARMSSGLSKRAETLAQTPDPDVDRELFNMMIIDSLRAYDRRWFLFESVQRYDAIAHFPKIKQPVLLMAFGDELYETTLKAGPVIPTSKTVDLKPVVKQPFMRSAKVTAEASRAYLDQPLQK